MISNRKAGKNDIGRYTANGFVETGKNVNSHPKGNGCGVVIILLSGLAVIGYLLQFVV